jgi:hypothetical protein
LIHLYVSIRCSGHSATLEFVYILLWALTTKCGCSCFKGYFRSRATQHHTDIYPRIKRKHALCNGTKSPC